MSLHSFVDIVGSVVDKSVVVDMRELFEFVNKRIGDDKWMVDPPGKEGVWRRVGHKNVFYPDDGSAPVGFIGKKKKAYEKQTADLLSTIATLKKKASGKDKQVLDDMEKALKSGDAEAFKTASDALDKILG